jgi:hypothetical protein
VDADPTMLPFFFSDETRDDLLIKRQEPKHTPTNKQPLLKVA